MHAMKNEILGGVCQVFLKSYQVSYVQRTGTTTISVICLHTLMFLFVCILEKNSTKLPPVSFSIKRAVAILIGCFSL